MPTLLLLVGVTGLTAVHLVPATAWWAMLPMLAGIRVPWSRAASTFYAAQAIGGVTPANIGGDVHRAVAVRGAGLSWATSVAPLIVQRATSYAALGLLSLLAVAVLVSSSALAVPLVAVGVGNRGPRRHRLVARARSPIEARGRRPVAPRSAGRA